MDMREWKVEASSLGRFVPDLWTQWEADLLSLPKFRIMVSFKLYYPNYYTDKGCFYWKRHTQRHISATKI